VPEQLSPAVLVDPFGGRALPPLRYRPTNGGRGFLLYSVGPDMRDDGGVSEKAPGYGPGDIVAIAGIPEIMIGDTLADADNPVPLPVITIDDPSIGMTLGVNTSPLAGQTVSGIRPGTKLTARFIKSRLEAELVGNVSTVSYNHLTLPTTYSV